MKISGDYHVHTAFCPHGSSDILDSYIEQAIQRGLNEISFTEHAPLPESFQDPTPLQDSAMRWEDLHEYISVIKQAKERYKRQIKINLGFEVDYIEGFEKETTDFLNEYGPFIDDGILSVHMLKTPSEDDFVCIDYSSDEFARIIQLFGSVEAVYDRYYRTVEKAIRADLGTFKPKRIGHLTLIRKFQKKYTVDQSYEAMITYLLDLIVKYHHELDINTAGLFKEHCGTIYPPEQVIYQAIEKGITLKPGSDSHQANHIGRGFEHLSDLLN